ncbi:nicotinamide riboside transporter PnuC [Thalassotalea eurytherma]|uniref:Nicotinamide riboside transporter PnuC n=1 Tax=Thalassotalea eurytherma TaxID=1144278 RepID=A0ABQ6H2T3_9GAMM|nr:nicotinamide riboside transporter PnuC [Thalassotalea eurytherma]GLX81829.1 nicotinamide mononucleotide transporter [Thalassotalea eurytherma]
MDFLSTFNYYLNMPVLELIAVITALLYVIFAAKGSIWCWPMALISTLLYTAIFYDVYLWMDSVLQVYYFAMAIIGWLNWQQAKQKSSHLLPIHTMTLGFHLKAIAGLVVLGMLVGYLMATYTPTDFPFIDALTTVFAVFGTYLVVKRVLENWLYWVVIDLVSIFLYIEKDLQPTAALFVFYTGFALFGFIQWYKMYRLQNAEQLSLATNNE